MMQRILMCDHPEMVELAKEILENYPVEIFSVESHNSIEAKVKEINPAIILLDLHHPCNLTPDTIDSLKKSNVIRNIPIILFSSIPDLKLKVSEFGADGYLSKPFSITQLEKLIQKLTVPTFHNN